MNEKLIQLKSDLGDRYGFIEHQHEELNNIPVTIDEFKNMLINGTTKGKITEPLGVESNEYGELDGKTLWSLQAGDMRIDLRIWQYDLLEQGEFGNGIDFRVYSNVFSKLNKHFETEIPGGHLNHSDLDMDAVNSIADIENMMFNRLDEVVMAQGLRYLPLTQQELYEQAVADDRFYFKDSGRVEQVYYNPDGNEENGQYVSDNYDYTDILKAAEQADGSTENFFEHFYEVSKQYLTDNDGGADFLAEYERFNSDEHDLIGCTDETMQKLIEFAHEHEKVVTAAYEKLNPNWNKKIGQDFYYGLERYTLSSVINTSEFNADRSEIVCLDLIREDGFKLKAYSPKLENFDNPDAANIDWEYVKDGIYPPHRQPCISATPESIAEIAEIVSKRAGRNDFNEHDYDNINRGITDFHARIFHENAEIDTIADYIIKNGFVLPELKQGDFIDFDNKRWYVNYVDANSIRLRNINPLDGTMEYHASDWKRHVKHYRVVDKNEVDMSTLKPAQTVKKPSLMAKVEDGKEKVRQNDLHKEKSDKPKNFNKGVDD